MERRNQIINQRSNRKGSSRKQQYPAAAQPHLKKKTTNFPQHKLETTDASTKVAVRCVHWPNCDNDACQYAHPSRQCSMFPSCSFGDKCVYIHPSCKFDALCTRVNCHFFHTSNKRLQSTGVKPVGLHISQVKCKYYPNCTRLNCPFMHSNDPNPDSDDDDRLSTCSSTEYRIRSSRGSGESQRGFRGSQSHTNLSTSRSSSSKASALIERIVSALSQYDSFSGKLLKLMDEHGLHYQSVRNIAKEHAHIFLLDDEKVTLKPTLTICSSHLKEGCNNVFNCNSLHICKDFVDGKCSNNNCIYGHNWGTNHNSHLLGKFSLGMLKNDILGRLFQQPHSKINQALEVCEDFNFRDCPKTKCPKLHICISYLAGTCSHSNCTLNHNFSNKAVYEILKQHLSVDESSQDIRNNLRTISSIKKQLETFILSNDTLEGTDDPIPIQKSESKDKEESITKASPPKKITTLWSDVFAGNVTIPEICYASVESICDYEDIGCWRLHSTKHFFWQIKPKEKDWINLPMNLVIELEKQFCDPKNDGATLPSLSPDSIEKSLRRLLLILGRLKWKADFEKMILTCDSNQDQLDLRRLQTEQTNNEVPEACKQCWYFLDVNQTWIEYGNIDTSNKENLRSNMDSDAIEKEYLKDNTAMISFSNAEFKYSLDPAKMVQTNLKTGVVREVRRRPRLHLKESETQSMPHHTQFDIPGYWEPMGKELSRLVTLVNSSEEYKKVSSLFSSKGGTYNILKIERVQNPFLLRAFQNKQREVEALYKDAAETNIQQLFHGTRPDLVDTICNENFDWRLHGTNVGQAYGRGSYFAVNPATSYGYTTSDASNHRFMFVAKVIVGRVTRGNSRMTRPPINSVTKVPFESTVDNISNPGIIVKYDKQEYYPEYILTLG